MSINLDVPQFGILGDFTISCAFIVALCRSLIERVAERSLQGRSFLHYGPMVFIQ